MDKSSAERVADKIGMITSHTTHVEARATMPRSATKWRPRAWHEEPHAAGIEQRRECRGRIVEALASRCGVASSSGGSAPTRSCPILPQPEATGFYGRSALSAS
jgi:hypothetical protein